MNSLDGKLYAGGYRSVQVHDSVYCLYIKPIRSFQLRVLRGSGVASRERILIE